MSIPNRRKKFVTYVVAALGSVLLLYARIPQQFQSPMLWAEDGVVFFLDQWEWGRSAIFRTYSAYHLLYHRLVAEVAAALPLKQTPWVYSWAAFGAYALILLLLASPRARLRGKPLLVLTLPLLPLETEVLMNLTNSHWYLAIATFVLVSMDSPQTRLGKFSDGLLFVLCNLTGPSGTVILPLVWVRWWLRRDGFSLLLGVLATLCSAVQIWNFGGARSPFVGDHSVYSWLMLIGQNFALLLFRFQDPPVDELGLWLMTLGSVGILGAVTWTLMRQKRFEEALFPIAGTALFIATALKFHDDPLNMWIAKRYYFLPSLGLVWGMCFLWREFRIATPIFLSLFAVSQTVSNYHFQHRIEPLRRWKRFASCIEKAKKPVCSTPIAPPGFELHIDPRSRNFRVR